jgi:sugar transferase EpsL
MNESWPTEGQYSAALALKSAFDRLGAALLLILVSPVMGVVALLVRWKLGRPALFHQRRPGLEGKIFELLKFRTMTDARDAQGKFLPDDARLTRFGRGLRSLSLDELPQLWNVLRGELSFVGPRPLLAEYLDRYTPEQARRHLVKPGITGWAQINGRNAISWDKKFALDTWYVDHWSLGLDLRIVLLTVLRVFAGNGVSQAGHATMPEFMGSASVSISEGGVGPQTRRE